jgi:tetratricopeptide (TPR) repeat protein
MRAGRRFSAVLLLTLGLAGPSLADPKSDERALKAKTAAGRARYEEGAQHYNLGEYDQAIAAFKEAYRLSNDPSLLYNIAQAYRKKGAEFCEPALDFYRSYLRARPDDPGRESLDARMRELAACIQQGSPVSPPTSHAEPPSPSTPKPVVPDAALAPAPPPLRLIEPVKRVARPTRAQWAVGGTGLGLVVAGGVLYAVVAARYHELEGQCPCPRSRWQDWRGAEIGSYVALGAGGVALAGALTWWALTRTSRSVRPSN